MDNLVGDIPTTYSTSLQSGSFEGSTGAPEAAKPGQFRMRMRWQQLTIDGVYDRTTVYAEMYFYHYWEWYSYVLGNGSTYITINGNKKLLSANVNVDGAGGEYLIMYHSVEVPTSTTSITISGRCDIGQSFDLPIWYGVEGSSSIALINPTPPIPPVPLNATISGKYEKGQATNITFTGSGNITGYYIYFRFWRKSGEYSSWYYKDTGSTNTSGYYSLFHTNGADGWDCIQMAVSAYNAGGESAKKETDWIYHQGVNVNSATGFVKGQIRAWDGSSWVQGYMKVWNGSTWVNSQ